MGKIATLALVLTVFTMTSAARADLWPQADGPMEHVFVGLDGTNIDVWLENPSEPPLPMLNHGESYTTPADVLDGKGYSSQFGWLVSGTWAPPPNSSVWVRIIDQTAGLETYEGGMRSMTPTHTFNPLFGTAASDDTWRWSGTMVHNWYAASAFGDYEATYEVYIGDSNGTPDPAYGADTITLSWSYLPEPGTLWMLGLAGLAMRKRR